MSDLSPSPAPASVVYAPAPKRGGVLTKLLTSVLLSLFVISILGNVYLGMIVASLTSGPSETTFAEGDTLDRIVILPIIGSIDSDMASYVRKALDKIRKDPPAALILRVESGGGGVGASDQIWHYVTEFKKETQIPILASFGTVAASGGYYVAAPSDYILCEEAAITGSIGVIAQVPTVDGLMQKIGVSMNTIVAKGSYEKDLANNPFRAWTPEDAAVVQNLVDVFYDRFVAIVDEGRPNMTTEEVKTVATGQVLTAGQALDLKLIDEVGYLSDAITKAGQLASLAGKPKVTIIRQPGGLGLLGLLGMSHPGLSAESPWSAQNLRSLANELSEVRFDYRMQLR